MKKKKNSSAVYPIAQKDDLLGSFESFMAHTWAKSLKGNYERDYILANQAHNKMVRDIEIFNENYREQTEKTYFTSVKGRAKEEESFFRKLYKMCCERSGKTTLTQETLSEMYGKIHDLCGVRFSVPYIDQVKITVDEILRPLLSTIGYAIDIQDEQPDKDLLEEGDDAGYRAYHFFVKIPTTVDIFGNAQEVLCEVQGRSELQNVWASKSHDLLYKPDEGWQISDEHIEDMKNISKALNAADYHLKNLRNRIKESKSKKKK